MSMNFEAAQEEEGEVNGNVDRRRHDKANPIPPSAMLARSSFPVTSRQIMHSITGAFSGLCAFV